MNRTTIEYCENDTPKAILVRTIKAMEYDGYSRGEIKNVLLRLSVNYNTYEEKDRFEKLLRRQ